MKILVTGANGQLGYEILRMLNQYEVFGFGKDELDITDAASVHKCMEEVEPDFSRWPRS